MPEEMSAPFVANVEGAGYKGVSPYSASKAGIAGPCKMVAREVGACGITVNAITPGPTKIPTRKTLIDNKREIAETVPLRILAKAEEIVHSVFLPSSDPAGFPTAQVLFIDEGISIPWEIDHFLPTKSK